MLCDIDILTPDGNMPLASIRNIEMQKACDQMGWWLSQGLSVIVRVVRDEVASEQQEKEATEIISFAALDIPY